VFGLSGSASHRSPRSSPNEPQHHSLSLTLPNLKACEHSTEQLHNFRAQVAHGENRWTSRRDPDCLLLLYWLSGRMQASPLKPPCHRDRLSETSWWPRSLLDFEPTHRCRIPAPCPQQAACRTLLDRMSTIVGWSMHRLFLSRRIDMAARESLVQMGRTGSFLSGRILSACDKSLEICPKVYASSPCILSCTCQLRVSSRDPRHSDDGV